MTAAAHALTVLGWLEMSDKDQPPERIWLNDEALTAHFNQVRERYAMPSTGSTEDDGPLTQNELTKGLSRG